MALFRRFFYRKPPDRLLEISERVYGLLSPHFPLDTNYSGEGKVKHYLIHGGQLSIRLLFDELWKIL
ncbi:Formin-like protein [Vigna angularis]|uniref:Formin-like protein n=1 Tax=Phaseolus angularis TaxID=3914 RepID=A0A8T0L6F7_PHAAN|nr:Formin-like protein [Vigna angularis]